MKKWKQLIWNATWRYSQLETVCQSAYGNVWNTQPIIESVVFQTISASFERRKTKF